MAQDSTTDTLAAALLGIAHDMPEIHDAQLNTDGTAVEVTVTPGTGTFRIPLARFAQRVLATPASERPAQLRAMLASVVETAAATATPEDDGAAGLHALRPMVFAAEQANTGVPTVASEIVPGVAEVLVLDRPTTAAQVTPANLDRWGITADEAFRAARDNLAEAPEPGGWERVPGAKLWQLTRSDSYVASRVFAPGWLTRNSPPGLGQLFIAVPTRELVFAGRVGEVGSDLARVAELVRHAWKNGHERVSPVLYGVDSTGAACPLSVKGDRRATRELRTSELSHLMTAYARQLNDCSASAPAGDHWQELGGRRARRQGGHRDHLDWRERRGPAAAGGVRDDPAHRRQRRGSLGCLPERRRGPRTAGTRCDSATLAHRARADVGSARRAGPAHCRSSASVTTAGRGPG